MSTGFEATEGAFSAEFSGEEFDSLNCPCCQVIEPCECTQGGGLGATGDVPCGFTIDTQGITECAKGNGNLCLYRRLGGTNACEWRSDDSAWSYEYLAYPSAAAASPWFFKLEFAGTGLPFFPADWTLELFSPIGKVAEWSATNWDPLEDAEKSFSLDWKLTDTTYGDSNWSNFETHLRNWHALKCLIESENSRKCLSCHSNELWVGFDGTWRKWLDCPSACQEAAGSFSPSGTPADWDEHSVECSAHYDPAGFSVPSTVLVRAECVNAGPSGSEYPCFDYYQGSTPIGCSRDLENDSCSGGSNCDWDVTAIDDNHCPPLVIESHYWYDDIDYQTASVVASPFIGWIRHDGEWYTNRATSSNVNNEPSGATDSNWHWYAGEWDSGTTYAEGDYVTYNDKVYECVVASPTVGCSPRCSISGTAFGPFEWDEIQVADGYRNLTDDSGCSSPCRCTPLSYYGFEAQGRTDSGTCRDVAISDPHPSVGAMAAGFLKSVGRAAQAAVRGEQVLATAETREQRLKVCGECPLLLPSGRCDRKKGGCGCVVKAKASLENESCPLKKW